MKSIIAILGPRDAGPGEREQMLDRAHRALDQLGVDSVTRIDVPAKGTSGESDDGVLRAGIDALIPALQSGSLFGGRVGLLVVGADQFLKAEAEIAAELIDAIDPEAVVAVFVAAGSIPAPLGKTIREIGETIAVRKMREYQASDWLAQAARDRRIRVHPDAAAALVQRFGTDTGSLGRALDQLAAAGEEITAEAVQARFRNRPDEPMWHFSDAVAAGQTGEALRRLADFLTHGHPLQLLASIEGDLRRQSLAAVAPDLETFADWSGAAKVNYGLEKVWKRRTRVSPASLRAALDAVSRADLKLKSAPEATHRLTMERLTVALCRWYGGR